MINRESKLAKELNDKLKRDAHTADAPIEAIDHNGVITLVGTVTSNAARTAAARVTFAHPGVLSVINDIQVDDPEATTELDALLPHQLDIAYPN